VIAEARSPLSRLWGNPLVVLSLYSSFRIGVGLVAGGLQAASCHIGLGGLLLSPGALSQPAPDV
jgi:hypothetical protein